MKILWLASWYPSRIEPFNGDFVQRHAEAASLHYDIEVLHLIKDNEGLITKNVLIDETRKGQLTEKIIYYHSLRTPVLLLNKVLSIIKYRKVFRQQAINYIRQNGKPDLVHVHVPWKAGLTALWLKRTFKIPFVITEHWGIYNNTAEDNIYKKPLLLRRLLKTVYKEARAFATPSRFLGEGVNATLVKTEYSVIPNVVNTAYFHPGSERASQFTFLHVSSMVPLKNVESILTAFNTFLKKTGADACLVLVGNRDDRYPNLAERKNLLGKSVFFTGEVPYTEVAEEMRKAHAFVLNSSIENSPCVIGEALCCGLPVIATYVGGIPELVDESNSLLVPPLDERRLAEAMIEVYREVDRFKQNEIAESAKSVFSIEKIASQFDQFYRNVLR